MGREVWIYRIDTTAANKNLPEILTDQSRYSHSFEDFVTERCNNFGEQYDLTYSGLLEKISKEVGEITPKELFEITFWFTEVAALDTRDEDFIQKTGIELLYESSTKSEANGVMLMYYSYLDLFEKDAGHRLQTETGVRTSTTDFQGFLDYFIAFLDGVKALNLNNEIVEDVYPRVTKAAIDQVLSERKSDQVFTTILKKELTKFRELFSNHDNHGAFPEFDLIPRNTDLMLKALEMRRKVSKPESIVIILDSV